MTPRDPNLRAALAGEYALGTLHGRARRRFEKLMAEDPGLAGEVARWETRLAPLGEAVRERRPPERVWEAVLAEVGTPPSTPWWQRVGFWRAATACAGVAALVLALALVAGPEAPGPRGVSVAVLAGEDARAAWLVRADLARAEATIRALAPEPLPADRRYELWAIPPEGSPHSLGLLPTGDAGRLALTPASARRLAAARALAVSLEPAGGSPTGAPTGPVLYQGVLLGPGG